MQTLTLLIMAKAPRPGYAKTRLIPALGAEGAARLAHRMLEQTLNAALQAQIGTVELCTSPAIDSPEWQAVTLPPGLRFSHQGEGDLGQRMARASKRALTHSGAVIIIGTDCVDMNPQLLRRAATQLNTQDAVIYPTRDGGYALLGLRRFAPSLFQDMPWSTDAVFEHTCARIDTLGWSLAVGEVLQDVDEPGDLVHLEARTDF
ncbi:TIGR04282 family arsenosugar biosynthesis glycosyltransferase [Marinimicrobium sp. ABcell2]|uniref:TIGR04282 family arsenosugar biosynthesis glycosyltransferase n=1 Tax=Marinimicrobium sp. ABcell2 TaxID=3069751 RepID=UPI0027B02606|nr:TIGR04282 family arsenosugar biosynthesis glycosyltransferase [Marinimicrobium sp. ABcell2]MDQ2076016.1 TIGR04282 family arsenosugar biosynthesis glycosyltransferase [Marinimicrobium sp. ABcell2]